MKNIQIDNNFVKLDVKYINCAHLRTFTKRFILLFVSIQNRILRISYTPNAEEQQSFARSITKSYLNRGYRQNSFFQAYIDPN